MYYNHYCGYDGCKKYNYPYCGNGDYLNYYDSNYDNNYRYNYGYSYGYPGGFRYTFF